MKDLSFIPKGYVYVDCHGIGLAAADILDSLGCKVNRLNMDEVHILRKVLSDARHATDQSPKSGEQC